MKILRIAGTIQLPDDFHGDIKDALTCFAGMKEAGVIVPDFPPSQESIDAIKPVSDAFQHWLWERFAESLTRGRKMACMARLSEFVDHAWVEHGQVIP